MTKILLPMEETNLTWDEFKPGAVVMDEDRDEWTLGEEGWTSPGYLPSVAPSESGPPHYYGPFTVVLEVPVKPQDLVDGLRWDPRQGEALPGIVNTQWGVQDKVGVHAVSTAGMARKIVENMQKGFDTDAYVVWRGVTDWQRADNCDD